MMSGKCYACSQRAAETWPCRGSDTCQNSMCGACRTTCKACGLECCIEHGCQCQLPPGDLLEDAIMSAFLLLEAEARRRRTDALLASEVN